MRIDIHLAEIDSLGNKHGWNSVILNLYKYESAIKKCSYDCANVLFYGKTEDIPESLLEVIIGENGNTVIGKEDSTSDNFIIKETHGAKESIDFVTKYYPEFKYCSILKQRIVESYF